MFFLLRKKAVGEKTERSSADNGYKDNVTQIFKEWLPGNPDYELCGNASAEWYDCVNGEKTDKDYHSAIWIPVKKKD